MLDHGASSDPLRGGLCVSQIKEAPYFEAISYVWGTPNRTIEIICDGQRILITPTLDQVLRRIHLPDRPRSLWTDSLCINQDNLEEKGHQIALMGRIYRQSDHTLIVIGVGDCGRGAPTAALLKEVDESIFTKVRPDWDTLPFLEHDHPLMDDPRWSSLHDLLGTAWFERG
jgi:hypothetical protein